MMTMMSSEKLPLTGKSEYDDDNDENRYREVPAMRSRMDEADAGSPEIVPELQTNEMGHAVKMGYVYFIETEDSQFIKIGYSTKPVNRAAQLGTLMPVRLLGCLPGSRGTEKWLHQRFAAEHKIGEWFHSSTELRNLIGMIGLMAPIESRPPKQPKPPKQAKPPRQPKPPKPPKLLKPPNPTILPADDKIREVFSMLGRRGGPARARSLTAEQRKEIARKAAATR